MVALDLHSANAVISVCRGRELRLQMFLTGFCRVLFCNDSYSAKKQQMMHALHALSTVHAILKWSCS